MARRFSRARYLGGLLKLRGTGVYHWPVSAAAGTPLLKDIRTGSKLIVREFADASGRPYVMLVNRV